MKVRAAFRQKLNLPPEQFDGEEMVGMLVDEIDKAYQQNMTDEEIAHFLQQTGVTLSTDEMRQAYQKAKQTKQ